MAITTKVHSIRPAVEALAAAVSTFQRRPSPENREDVVAAYSTLISALDSPRSDAPRRRLKERAAIEQRKIVEGESGPVLGVWRDAWEAAS